MIGGIQSEARKAVDNMEKSTLIVDEGLTLGTDLSLALRRISDVVTEVFKFSQEIGRARMSSRTARRRSPRLLLSLTRITLEITSSVEQQAVGAQAVVHAMDRIARCFSSPLPVQPNWPQAPSRCRRWRAPCWNLWTASFSKSTSRIPGGRKEQSLLWQNRIASSRRNRRSYG